MMTPVKLDRAVKKGHRVGAFGIEILYPGLALDQGDRHAIKAEVDTDLVLFTTDTDAPVFTGGMFSGSVLAR